jgi:cupin 2 domain-containing protein
MSRGNLTADIPAALPDELVTVLTRSRGVRIERIVSRGHTSPPDFWYDQAESELVLVVQGAARLLIEGRPELALGAGDWVELAPHVRHRVTWTDPTRDTIWLAVFYLE